MTQHQASLQSLVGPLKRAVYPLSSRLIATASLVDGDLKGGRGRFRCLFVHHSMLNRDLEQRMYDGEPTVVRRRRVLIPTLRTMVERDPVDFDICVAVLPRGYERVFEGTRHFKGREEVRQVIDTRGGWDVVRQRFSKKKRQTTNDFTERFGLSYRLSKDMADFDLFYYRMHVPHIRRRYGELAQIDSYEETKKFFRDGVLLFVTKNDEPVAGALSLVQGRSLVFRRTGVLDGDETVVRGGAQTALYYFQLKYAVDNGLSMVDTMKTAPFLNDGVFRHKAEWGARALPDHEAKKTVYWFTRGSAEGLARFFDVNPVVVDAGSRLVGIVGDPQGDAPMAEMQRRFHTRGLHDLLVYSPAGTRTMPLAGEP